jgi:xylitol oxidase
VNEPANWAGTYRYRAARVWAPGSVDELREIVAQAPRVRALGSRHSFTGIADSGELVTLERLPRQIAVDADGRTVRVSGAVRYGELAVALREHGLALANLASLPHISIAGAVATATHGSGERHGNLATAVSALELITSSGEALVLRRGEADFDGGVVGLGATGVVVALTLDVVPEFQVRQRVFERLSWKSLFERFDEIAAGAYSVSMFTRWGSAVDQVWLKTRVADAPDEAAEELFGARAASVDVHPIAGMDPVNATPQLGKAGPWSERLPHFRMGFTPSSGEEIQSEYIVARRHAAAAIQAVLKLAAVVRPLTQVSEIRMIAADTLWMSPQYGQDTVAIHFTWKREPARVDRAVAAVERMLEPFAPRPHWGKLFRYDAAALAPRYERWGDFVDLIDRLDPRHAFRNAWLEAHVLRRR